MKKLVPANLLFLLLAALPLGALGPSSRTASAAATSTSRAPVDVNSASQNDLEALPGIGAATARKIIAHRPYRSVQELSRAGVSSKTITEIAPLVTAGRATSEPPPEIPARREKRDAGAAPAPSPTHASPLDLNTASEADLEKLPGVGSAYARRIVDGRPYATVADLSRARLPKATLDRVTPLVTVTGAGGASTPMGAGDRPLSPAPPPKSRPSETAAPEAPAQTPPSAGMVWVNTDTKIYHLEGDRWYGKTLHGKWMTEAEAVQSGYRKAKR
jgi:DNA uptake protein ComE-like DNA-binding protein